MLFVQPASAAFLWLLLLSLGFNMLQGTLMMLGYVNGDGGFDEFVPAAHMGTRWSEPFAVLDLVLFQDFLEV
jgi:hypothetical protein